MSSFDSPAPQNHLLGVILALCGGTVLSMGGPLIRLIEEADGWSVMFYRGISFFAMLLVIITWQSRGRTLERYLYIGWGGFWIAVCLGIGFISYLFAMLHTTVANVVFVVGASPLVTAALAWIILGERLSIKASAILALALGGIAIMVWDGLASGQLLGSIIALGATFTFSMMVILLRMNKDTDMLAATSLAGLVAAAVALLLVETLILSTNDMIVSLALGAVQVGLGFTFITYASRYIPAAEVTLLALIETLLAPVWTWMVVGEVPGMATFTGGAMVLTCVAVFALISMREETAGSTDYADVPYQPHGDPLFDKPDRY
jgi:drug/metabolite transporter (DMT)-like permease